MHHRTVDELMTHDVVRARRDTPFKDVVRLLAENEVTAIPVVDDLERPMGVVSEADLLRKSSGEADPSGRTPLPHLEARERAKAEGARAVELMAAPAVRARPGPARRGPPVPLGGLRGRHAAGCASLAA